MEFTKGLFTDTAAQKQPAGTWRYARNLVVTERLGSLVSELGLEQLSIHYALLPLGKISLGDKRTVVFSLDEDNVPEIGILTPTDYVTLIRDNALNFQRKYPILSGEYQLTIRGQDVIAWTDNLNPPRLLNLSDIGFALNPDKSLVNPDDFAISELIAPTLNPVVDLVGVYQGGQLLAGSYSYAVAYEDLSGFVTKWSPASYPVSVTDDALLGSYQNVDGAVGGTPTTKSVQLQLSNLDTRYAYVRVAAIQRINQVVTAVEFQRIRLRSTSLRVVHAGTETTTSLVLADVLVPPPNYKTVKTLTQLNDELFLGGLTLPTPIDYQVYANNIKVDYISSVADIKSLDTSYKNPSQAYYFRPFLHGEVYAFYIVFHLKSGGLSPAFHIPGREATAITGNSLGRSETTLLSTLIEEGQPYLVTDNSLGPTVRYFQTRDTANNPAAPTNMGFWQNENETYADEAQSDVYDSSGFSYSLRGQQVRHHKFPELDTAHYPSGASGQGAVLGVRLSNIYIPPAIADQITGYELYYATRGVANATIVGQSLSTFCSTQMMLGENGEIDPTPVGGVYSNGDVQIANTTEISSTGGNWHYYLDEDSTPDKWAVLRKDYIRMHPVDSLATQQKIVPTHITHQVMLGKTAKFRNIQESNQQRSLLLEVNHLEDGVDYGITGTYAVLPTHYLYTVAESQFVSTNSNPAGKLNNIGVEESLVLKINDPNADYMGLYSNYPATPEILPGYVHDYVRRELEDEDEADYQAKYFRNKPAYMSGGTEQYGGRWVHNYLTNLRVYRTDVYTSYRSQELLATGKRGIGNTLPNIYGGDSFFGNYGVRMTGPSAVTVLPVDEYPADPNAGIKVAYHYAVESTANIALRHIDYSSTQAALQTTYYPKVGSDYINSWLDLPLTQALTIGYNVDYSSGNDLAKSYPFEPDQFVGNFPTRIHRSRKSQREERASSWRTFPANDYYEMRRNRGFITNLASMGGRLLIHHEQSLFRTIDKAQLVTDTVKIQIGAGDIFDQEPEELIYGQDGYAGTRYTSACLVTKLGYFFPSDNGKVFLLTDQLREISLNGMRNHFRYELFGYGDSNNPYDMDSSERGNGLSVVYDEKYNRILLSAQGLNPNDSRVWTLSYSGDMEAWVAEHEYVPAFYTSSGGVLLSIRRGSVYRHHANYPGIGYDGEATPIVQLDVVFNPVPELAKLFYGLRWNADVYSTLLPDTPRDAEFSINHYDDSFTRLLLFTNRQCSGYLDVSHLRKGRNVEEVFYYNEFRSLVIDEKEPIMSSHILRPYPIPSNLSQTLPWFRKGRFTSTHLIVRFEYTPTDGRTLSLQNADALFRPTNRLTS